MADWHLELDAPAENLGVCLWLPFHRGGFLCGETHLHAVPIRPKAPVLIGDDPYHTEIPSFAATSSEPGFMRRRTNVLDSLDLGDLEQGIPLDRPKRLIIEDE